MSTMMIVDEIVDEEATTCVVVVLSLVINKPCEEVSGLLKSNLQVLQTKTQAGMLNSDAFGNEKTQHYHHTLVEYVLNLFNLAMVKVSNTSYKTIFNPENKDIIFLVYGVLNYNFQPWFWKGKGSGKVATFNNKDCEENLFWGNDGVRGEKAQFHCIMIKNNSLHCTNLRNANKELFTINAKWALPMGCGKKDKQLRILKAKHSAYMESISAIYQLGSTEEYGTRVFFTEGMAESVTGEQE